MLINDDVLDRQAILERVGDDSEVLATIIQMFHDEVPQMVGDLKSAIQTGNATHVEKSAHFFKSSIGNFTTGTAYVIVHQLEMMGKSGELSGATSALVELEDAIARLRTSLDKLLQECR